MTSRSAENLFWLGRYAERAENCVRLGADHARSACPAIMRGGTRSLRCCACSIRWRAAYGLVGDRACLLAEASPAPVRAQRSIHALGDTQTSPPAWPGTCSALQSPARMRLRERISSEHWKLIHDTADQFNARTSRQLLESPITVASHGRPMLAILRAVAHRHATWPPSLARRPTA